jgi:hypothetical protein
MYYKIGNAGGRIIVMFPSTSNSQITDYEVKQVISIDLWGVENE